MATKSTHFIDSQVSNDQSVTDSLDEPAKVFVADGVSQGMGQTTALQGQTSPDHGAALVPGANRALLGTWDTGELLSESLFVALFETMSEGMALHEMVVGADAIVTDYRIVNVNPAFESQTGLTRELVVGKLATQAYGITPAPFLEMYGRVARTGVLSR